MEQISIGMVKRPI